MFEKSLYDLIRGLRNDRGNERDYIAARLKECRAEIKSPDLDRKATALLKLVYLEMLGHDMSWAAFYVLEVMSSPNFHQKRVGYLAAVQSFRPDTEVLMLATNLLKKDLAAAAPKQRALAIAALPHIITPSLALATQPDLLLGLRMGSVAIRKKTVVTLFRLALIHPDTLVASWPLWKESLMDPHEDPAVTAAIANVICELGWRRPKDFLPLAPRLFELLVTGGNNWMAIKLIKLFAVLTPLEPRLVRKLLPPLTELIRTTRAMSLQYECVQAIIQGGILGSSDEDFGGREEIASLCVDKLRIMIGVSSEDGSYVPSDPNLKYVALLAFNQIVRTHPFLVAAQLEDVILPCLESVDVTIRFQVLSLLPGLVVSGENLVAIVTRLSHQLAASKATEVEQSQQPTPSPPDVDSLLDEDDAESSTPKPPPKPSSSQEAPLPLEYQVSVVDTILMICAQDNYSNVEDFDWYIDILTQLFRLSPRPPLADLEDGDALAHGRGDSNGSPRSDATAYSLPAPRQATPVSLLRQIGNELRTLSVKVAAMRSTVVATCERLLFSLTSSSYPSISAPTETDSNLGQTTLRVSPALPPVIWLLGEFRVHVTHPRELLDSFLKILKSLATSAVASGSRTPATETLQALLTATLKLVTQMIENTAHKAGPPWRNSSHQQYVLQLLKKTVPVLEGLTQHPDLEVQARAVEFTELLKLAIDASTTEERTNLRLENDGDSQDNRDDVDTDESPRLLTEALPSLFTNWTLNSVATEAQRQVPLPDDLDLFTPIHPELGRLLQVAEEDVILEDPTSPTATTAHDTASRHFWVPIPSSIRVSAAAASLHQTLKSSMRASPFGSGGGSGFGSRHQPRWATSNTASELESGMESYQNVNTSRSITSPSYYDDPTQNQRPIRPEDDLEAKAERIARRQRQQQLDPFYIAPVGSASPSLGGTGNTPISRAIHDTVGSTSTASGGNGAFDVDQIPILELDIVKPSTGADLVAAAKAKAAQHGKQKTSNFSGDSSRSLDVTELKKKKKKDKLSDTGGQPKPKKKVKNPAIEIASDETVDFGATSHPEISSSLSSSPGTPSTQSAARKKRGTKPVSGNPGMLAVGSRAALSSVVLSDATSSAFPDSRHSHETSLRSGTSQGSAAAPGSETASPFALPTRPLSQTTQSPSSYSAALPTSGPSSLSVSSSPSQHQITDHPTNEDETDEEMARAMRELEKTRLQRERALERVQEPEDENAVVVVKAKKKKKKKATVAL